MPFTAAHPAIIIPLQRLHSRWLSTTGLIVGSISPDFAYFLLGPRLSNLSHSLKGLLLFNLPMAFVLAIFFHVLVRDQVIQYLPDYFRKKALAIEPLRIGKYLLRNAYIFAISVLIGAFGHLLWDSFTHYDGYFVRNNAFLLQPVSLGFIEVPLCRVLQHVSTVVGFSILGWHISTLPSATITQKRWYAWIGYWILIGFIAAVFLLLNLPTHVHLSSLEKLVVPYLTGLLLAIVVLAILGKIRQLFSANS
ncbi:DUF4184 family protein [Pontibacter burrus]|uniref:DUF4184 family protein n=1 Tax=Pontibacter burrus TaxID=2704466 RepID=A0A6B3LX71_9BACT|nr:DUF4184 family protein [Pontibacter burrus]NEM98220.1 DUF4184 family protein [Pontibacter burrus]